MSIPRGVMRSESESRSSSDSTSFSDSNTSWITSSSEDSFEEDNSEPQIKKQRRSFFEHIDIETESSYEMVLEACFKWNIKDFNEIGDSYKVGEKLESPVYTVGPNEELKWYLQLYPRGLSDQNKNYASLFLYLVSSKEPKIKVDYKCTFGLRKSSQNKFQGSDYFIQGQRFGWRKTHKTDFILRKLEHNMLKLTFDIKVVLSRANVNKIKVVDDIGKLLENGAHSDAVLKCEDKIFKVHKNILVARSPVFAAMFNHDMKEKAESIVEIDDISHQVMEEILRFTYTGTVKNLDILAKNLLAAADKYALENLKSICENALFNSLNVHNVVEIVNFAELHSALKLKEQALDYFVTHVKDVISTLAFKEMGDSQSPILAQVICMMAFNQKN